MALSQEVVPSYLCAGLHITAHFPFIEVKPLGSIHLPLQTGIPEALLL